MGVHRYAHEPGRSRPGRALRYIAGTLALALSATLIDGAGSAIAEAPQAPAAPKETAATQAADIPSARVAVAVVARPPGVAGQSFETTPFS
ncbi:hypothetical protein ACIOMQ_13075 [Streptomyces sp. NPDC087845]|uniref:hypothetical protein n=1 Tax=Streptomyces sp. NPDC087845 TaxID=3365806 RepID=UPI0037F64F2C